MYQQRHSQINLNKTQTLAPRSRLLSRSDRATLGSAHKQMSEKLCQSRRAGCRKAPDSSSRNPYGTRLALIGTIFRTFVDAPILRLAGPGLVSEAPFGRKQE